MEKAPYSPPRTESEIANQSEEQRAGGGFQRCQQQIAGIVLFTQRRPLCLHTGKNALRRLIQRQIVAFIEVSLA